MHAQEGGAAAVIMPQLRSAEGRVSGRCTSSGGLERARGAQRRQAVLALYSALGTGLSAAMAVADVNHMLAGGGCARGGDVGGGCSSPERNRRVSPEALRLVCFSPE